MSTQLTRTDITKHLDPMTSTEYIIFESGNGLIRLRKDAVIAIIPQRDEFTPLTLLQFNYGAIIVYATPTEVIKELGWMIREKTPDHSAGYEGAYGRKE